jgi:hypothetical protein
MISIYAQKGEGDEKLPPPLRPQANFQKKINNKNACNKTQNSGPFWQFFLKSLPPQ